MNLLNIENMEASLIMLTLLITGRAKRPRLILLNHQYCLLLPLLMIGPRPFRPICTAMIQGR